MTDIFKRKENVLALFFLRLPGFCARGVAAIAHGDFPVPGS